MASLVFNDAKLKIIDGTYNLSTSNLYFVLVTAAPAATVTQRSGLSEASGGNYTYQDMTSKTITLDSGTVYLASTNPIWNSLTTGTATPLVGAVICRRAGGSPASSDATLFYVEMTSTFTPNASSFQLVASSGQYLSVT